MVFFYVETFKKTLNKELNMSKKFTKPLPYMVQGDSYPIAAGAKWLRNTFNTLM